MSQPVDPGATNLGSNIDTVDLDIKQSTIHDQVSSDAPPDNTVYGEIIILGYNGSIQQNSDRGRRHKSKYMLCKRPTPNGIRKSSHYIVNQPQATRAILDKERHSISYTISRSQAIIVEYQRDSETDMFQIGRSSESPIDFVVIDTAHHPNHPHHQPNHAPSSSSSKHSNGQHQQPNLGQFSENNDLHLPHLSNKGHHHQHHLQNHFAMPSHHQHHGHHHHHHAQQAPSNHQNNNLHSTQPAQSTISRFACRILVDRKPPYTARIYAAGFDSSKNIFLGEKATKWEQNGEIDGLTTNGVLIMHPPHNGIFADGTQVSTENSNQTGNSQNIKYENGKPRIEKNSNCEVVTSSGGDTGKGEDSFVSNKNDMTTRADSNNVHVLLHQQSKAVDLTSNQVGVWREVSVNGGIYAIRESRSAAQKGTPVETETNVLQDGTLIDLCGATLLWRSVDGLKQSPTKKMLDDMVDTLNASRPQCPVGLNTLVIPRKPSSADYRSDQQSNNSHQPYVYLKCGHVQGFHDWGATKQSNQRTCPICLSTGHVVRLTMGLEPMFYVDCGPPTHVFNPCGHMASEKTIKYWSNVKIPHGTHFFYSICPFCAVPVTTDSPPYTKLIFQDFVD